MKNKKDNCVRDKNGMTVRCYIDTPALDVDEVAEFYGVSDKDKEFIEGLFDKNRNRKKRNEVCGK
jgi:hypothetical protein